MKTRFSNVRGFTILELMVAIFLFSIITYSLFSGLYTGDRIKGRANAARIASVLASNEAERIRSEALRGTEPQELAYTETVSGVTFNITRKKIYDLGGPAQNRSAAEIEITVEPENEYFPTYKFKLLQGFHQ